MACKKGKDFWKSGDSETRHINRWLAENCFGDYYTRKGLDLKQREMITFCFILAQGGCENQLTAHIQGNLNIGNDKEFLLKVLTQCLQHNYIDFIMVLFIVHYLLFVCKRYLFYLLLYLEYQFQTHKHQQVLTLLSFHLN